MTVTGDSLCPRYSGMGVMMLDAMQPGLVRSRLLRSLDGFQRKFNLRRRPGFGSLFNGDVRRSNRIPDTICRRHGHHEPDRSTVPGGHLRDQCDGIVLDWAAHDAFYRAVAATSELAIPVSRRFPGRIHNIFEFRVGNPRPGEGRKLVAGGLQPRGKCVAGVRRGMAGIDDRGQTLMIREAGKEGACYLRVPPRK
jgi:hypothetical protein